MLPVSILMASLISYEISITDPDDELNLGTHNVFHVNDRGGRMINTDMVPSIIKSWKFSTFCGSAPFMLLYTIF